MKSKLVLIALLSATTAGAQILPTQINQLPQISSLAGTELYPLQQSNGASGSVSSANLALYTLAQLSSSQVINLWTGNCSSSTVLGGNGACVPVGSGTGVGNVVTTGSPANGNLTKFSGASSITNGDLSGDCNTGGSLVVVCTKTNGVSFGNLATANAASPPALGGTTPANGTFAALVAATLTAGATTGSQQHNLYSGLQQAPTSNFTANSYLDLSGAGGNYLSFGQGPSSLGSGLAYGQWIQSGFPSASAPSYYALVLNPLGGGVTVGTPTGGNEGAGSLNVQSLYINGAPYGSSGLTSVGISAPAFLTVGSSPLTSNGTISLTYSGTALPVANGGTGSTTSTGTGSTVRNVGPTISNPTLTGSVSVPTQGAGDSSSNVASTAFVNPGSFHGGIGYEKLASGLILEWGIASVTSGGSPTVVTFPLAFPNNTLQVMMTPQYNGVAPAYGVGTWTTTSFNAYGNANYTWFAIGD